MGRLEDIVARNEDSKRPGIRVIILVGLVVLVIVTIILMTFTDLGMPKHGPERERRVDDIWIGSAATQHE